MPTKSSIHQLPGKTRELIHNHFDSARWNDFPFRENDIILGTYAKSGTTWVQQILGQLIFNGAEDIPVAELSPWLDLVVAPKDELFAALEAQTHRRFIKTHLPLDAMVYHEKVKYLYVARDGRDVVWSYHNHHVNHTDELVEAINANRPEGTDLFEILDGSAYDMYKRWLAEDGFPIWSFWENIASWWAARHAPNILLVHFASLKADLPGEMRKIAEFLDIEIDESKWDDMVYHCSFDYMKQHAELSTPLGGAPWKGGAKTFINKGTNGRWRDILSDAEKAEYEALAVEKLGAVCAHWLATGKIN
jgi:aryl sulfotransferase